MMNTLTNRSLFRAILTIIAFLSFTNGMASQRHDDTAELQKLIDNYQTIDLKGKEYYVSRLLLRNNTTLRNGTIYSEGQKCVCYAENAHNITLSDLKIDGNNSSGDSCSYTRL